MMKRKKEITEKEALNKLAALCSRAEHCSFEMRRKMTLWGLAEDAQNRVVDALTEGRYIVDERYARAFAIDKVRYDKWGRHKVDQALYMKHISEDIRRRVIDEIEETSFTDSLRPLLKAKMKSVKAKSDYELSCKLIRYALGRGYDMEEIRNCLGELYREEEDAEEDFQ